jgi:hypothetical protein
MISMQTVIAIVIAISGSLLKNKINSCILFLAIAGTASARSAFFAFLRHRAFEAFFNCHGSQSDNEYYEHEGSDRR